MKTKKILLEQITRIEIIAFIGIILVLWGNEIFDIPHLLFAVERTPVNWQESLLESILVVILAFLRNL